MLSSELIIKPVYNYFVGLQHDICAQLEAEDKSEKFVIDDWQNKLGHGSTRVLTNGKVMEQAGVSFSYIQGDSLPTAATNKHPELAGCSFEALGVSLVIHPQNPYVPTSHANVRLFLASNGFEKFWWFGGGYDLTPYYPYLEDCIHWHQTAKNACEPFGNDIYPQYKKQCDEYFYLKHRQETRGIGGLFFDDVNQWDFERCFAFIQAIGNSYIQAYRPIMTKRKNIEYGGRQREFQLYRRGRYVEFNLLYDRGTLFGLQAGGRTDSILMSLPPLVKWGYAWQPEAGSIEEKLTHEYLQPRKWV